MPEGVVWFEASGSAGSISAGPADGGLRCRVGGCVKIAVSLLPDPIEPRYRCDLRRITRDNEEIDEFRTPRIDMNAEQASGWFAVIQILCLGLFPGRESQPRFNPWCTIENPGPAVWTAALAENNRRLPLPGRLSASV